jgi:polynucleotide 5'-hydroxyl-kinase GRC3/NOL9
MNIIEISRNEGLVVAGPCKIIIKDGSIFIQGIEINEKIEIKDNKSFTVYTLNNLSKIETDCNIIAKSHEALLWHKIAEDIVKTRGTIIVLGEVDSGKSYFSNMICNISEIECLYVDSDIGQSSLFIPTFLAASKEAHMTLNPRERKISELQFFGDITPTSNPQLHVSLVTRLLEKNRSNINVIDTDGWLKGFRAYRHKLELLNFVNPDYIISFSKELIEYLPSFFRNRTISINKPNYIKKRSVNDRKKYRSKLYKDYFSNSVINEIELSYLFGKKIANYLFIALNELIQFIKEEPCTGYIIDYNDVNRLILGLTKSGNIIGAGLLVEIKEDRALISTPVKDFEGIILGRISLNENFEERRIRIKRCSNT